MKTFFKTKPILSFILLTFAITYLFWFLPVIITLPKDIKCAILIIGGSGPLLAGYIIMVLNSGAMFKIGSKPIFIFIFITTSIVFLLRLYFINKGLDDRKGILPELNEITPIGYIFLAIPFFIFGLNASNATNKALKENHIKTFLFDKHKIKWYFIALLLWPVIALSSYYIGVLFKLQTTDYVLKFEPVWFIGFFSHFFFFGGVEEFGWRGFLQKEMQKRFSPLITALLILILWSLWHLPHYYNGVYSSEGFTAFLPRFIFTLPLAIVFTWLYNKSSYSILAMVLLHSMWNNYAKIFGHGLFTEVLLIVCIFCIINDKMWKRKSYHSTYQNENYKK